MMLAGFSVMAAIATVLRDNQPASLRSVRGISCEIGALSERRDPGAELLGGCSLRLTPIG